MFYLKTILIVMLVAGIRMFLEWEKIKLSKH